MGEGSGLGWVVGVVVAVVAAVGAARIGHRDIYYLIKEKGMGGGAGRSIGRRMSPKRSSARGRPVISSKSDRMWQKPIA